MMVKIYEVYDCNETLAYTSKKIEAIKIQRYYRYTGNCDVHIAQHVLVEPFKRGAKYFIPKILYVRASTYKSNLAELKKSDIIINTFAKFNSPELKDIFFYGEKTHECKSDDYGCLYAYFTIDTRVKEKRATLVNRCKRLAIELFKKYNVKD